MGSMYGRYSSTMDPSWVPDHNMFKSYPMSSHVIPCHPLVALNQSSCQPARSPGSSPSVAPTPEKMPAAHGSWENGLGKHLFSMIFTWWLIPLSKWVITPLRSGLTLLIPFITGFITYLLSGMSHQVKIHHSCLIRTMLHGS